MRRALKEKEEEMRKMESSFEKLKQELALKTSLISNHPALYHGTPYLSQTNEVHPTALLTPCKNQGCQSSSNKNYVTGGGSGCFHHQVKPVHRTFQGHHHQRSAS